MIITIEGKQGEGKTTTAKKLAGDAPVVLLYESDLENKGWASALNSQTQFLIIEDVADIEAVKSVLEEGLFVIRRPYAVAREVVRIPPTVILVVRASQL